MGSWPTIILPVEKLHGTLEMANPFFVGIAGGSCTGKGYLCRHLQEILTPARCAVIPMDAYYRDLSYFLPHERKARNFDHPDAIDHSLFLEHLRILLAGGEIGLPAYDFATHTRVLSFQRIRAKGRIIFIEGLFALFWKEVRDLLTIKLFIDLGWETCLARRIERDMIERRRTRDDVEQQFHQSVLPMYENHVAPTCRHADLVLPGDAPIDKLTHRVLKAIAARGVM